MRYNKNKKIKIENVARGIFHTVCKQYNAAEDLIENYGDKANSPLAHLEEAIKVYLDRVGSNTMDAKHRAMPLRQKDITHPEAFKTRQQGLSFIFTYVLSKSLGLPSEHYRRDGIFFTMLQAEALRGLDGSELWERFAWFAMGKYHGSYFSAYSKYVKAPEFTPEEIKTIYTLQDQETQRVA